MNEYLIDITRRLVAEDTVSTHGNGNAADIVADELDSMGFHVALHETLDGQGPRHTNVVAWAGPPEPGGLILSGHIDTVPFDDQPGWNRDPLLLELDEGRLFGRGTSDMKGFIGQCLAALRNLDLSSLRSPVVLLFTCDEEVGCIGARKLSSSLSGLFGEFPIPRLAWIGEPTDYRVFHAHKGVVDFEIRVLGVGGHSSVPEEGCNAIAVAAQVVSCIGKLQEELRESLQQRFVELFRQCPYTSLNFGTIRGGLASNMIADECRIRVSYRPLPGSDPLSVYHEIERRVKEQRPGDTGSPEGVARIEFGEPLVAPGLNTQRGTELERALDGVIGTSVDGGAPWCTDAGQFAQIGIDSLICGPGELEQAHKPNESVSADALERGPRFIEEVIRRMCQDRSDP